ncbi:MAG: SDR family NAD(P)-dependent oxidoreductase [Legionellales bacterium]|nr:SDR family NAD(P)-dependent oxidoreductase [Legionellales bacterium]
MSKTQLAGKWALITGASRGIGRECAILLASMHCNIVIVARCKNDLEKLQQLVIKTYAIKCYIVVCDLSQKNATEEIFQQVEILNLSVSVLISNAGIGCYGIFGKMPIARQEKMMITNNYTPVTLTHRFLQQVNNSNEFYYIVHIGSIVGYMTIPGSAVYNASKSFIISFCKSLREELSQKYNNVSITVVSPGVTDTNFFNDADKEIPKINKIFIMSAERVANIVLRSMLEKKASVICGFRNKLLVNLIKLLPTKIIAKSQLK